MSSSIADEVSNDACGICSSGSSSKQIMSTSCEQKIMKGGVCENILCITNTTSSISDGINSMNISNNSITSTASASIPVCANCEKEGSSDTMNTCNKCKMVMYCNAACKKKHRHKHKKECEEYNRLATEHAAELRDEELKLAAEKHDKELFKQPPPAEDCPICFLRIPTLHKGWRYYSCCGKVICSGCAFAPVYDNQGNEVDNQKCAFCRTPYVTSDEEIIIRVKTRVELDDPIAIYTKGNYYQDGINGFPRDHTKALELFHRAGTLGYAEAYVNIGIAYDRGRGVEIDRKKAIHYYELAAMGGDLIARHNLGIKEEFAGNYDRVLKHYMIAVRGGHIDSLKEIKDLYTKGNATKEDYTTALRSYQEYLSEIKSKQRDEAAAYDNEEYGYY